MNRRATNGYARLETVDGSLHVRTQSREEDQPEHQEVEKGWESYSGWFWFGLEEVEPGYWFGFIQGHECELGYFTEGQLARPDIWEINGIDLPHAGRRVIETVS